ncbi:MAG: DUF3606 domain-containing protein [Flavisolibacter sp.]
MEQEHEPTILPEYARINVSNPKQVTFWSRHLGVTEEQLRHVIFICGPIVKEIREYLAACK